MIAPMPPELLIFLHHPEFGIARAPVPFDGLSFLSLLPANLAPSETGGTGIVSKALMRSYGPPFRFPSAGLTTVSLFFFSQRFIGVLIQFSVDSHLVSFLELRRAGSPMPHLVLAISVRAFLYLVSPHAHCRVAWQLLVPPH